MDKRKTWTYRGCTITPEIGEARYFGCANFVPDTRCPQYYTRWWKVSYPAGGYVLVVTKSVAFGVIDETARTNLLAGVLSAA